MNSNRLVYIDVAKCFAIFLVVWGHIMPVLSANAYDTTTIHGTLNSVIFSFNMPLFAILSGYFFSTDIGIRNFFCKKWRQLALPFLIWCFIIYLICPIIKSLFYGDRVFYFTLLKDFYYGLTDWGWWFIRALFLCFIYAYLSVKVFKYNKIESLFLSILVLYFFSFIGIIPNKLHFTLGFIFLYPFFCFGFFLRNNMWKIVELHCNLVFFSSFAVWMLLVFTIWKGFPDTFYGMNTSVFAPSSLYFEAQGLVVVYKSFLRIVIGVVSSLSIISCAYGLYSRLSKEENRNKIKIVLNKIGQNTLGIYIIQSLIFDNVDLKFNYFGYHPWANLILCLICSVILCLLCICIVNILEKNKYLRLALLGKR